MLKGPKAILSSAIANALGTYFDVDSSAIESNLIQDAKIVLNQVRLKKQTSRLALNSAGNATTFTVTGCFERVELSWEWSVGYGSQQLVKNAVLSLTEADYQCKLEHDEIQDVENSSHLIDASDFVDTNNIDDAMQQEIKQETGGITGYIYRQVNMIIDNLTLRVDGLDLQIILPPPKEGGKSKTILVCADELKLVSYGRKDKDGQELDLQSNESKSVVKQQLSMTSFLMRILEGGDDGDESMTEYPLIEPFSYSATVTKAGDRFGGMSTGLEVCGCIELTSSSRRLDLEEDTDSWVFHLGDHQIAALTQLSIMILSPPSDVKPSESVSNKEPNDSAKASFSSSSSSFHFPLAAASLILFDNSHAIHARGIDLNYKADGTVFSISISELEYANKIGGKAICSDLLLTERPIRSLKLGSIQTIHIPNVLELTSPVSPEITFEGSVLVVRVNESVNVSTYGNSSSSNDESTGWPLAPCGLDVFFREINLTKDADGSKMAFKALEIYANPTNKSTELAIKCSDFRNQVACVSKLEMSCALPTSEVNTVNDLNISMEKAEVKGGRSSEDWSDGFKPRPKERDEVIKPEDVPRPTVYKLPNTNIATLKLIITWSQTGISLKDTSFAIKPFRGNATTTSNDVVTYYTSACLAKAPEFISNASVLGINVVDQTVNTIGTWTLLPFLGAGGGVAVLTGVDAIKGAVASGKRARNAEEVDGYRPGDFVRGVFHAAVEATRDGRSLRGKKDDDEGNILDWAYGATKGTTDYVEENKTKLGGAIAGGGGFWLGMVVGGPIGAVVGGVAGNLVGGKTIEVVDDALNESRETASKSATKQDAKKESDK